jgi:ABC-type branched-subunit amino acid transport system substrate-binding protein
LNACERRRLAKSEGYSTMKQARTMVPLALLSLMVAVGCGKKAEEKGKEKAAPTGGEAAAAEAPKAGPGVDMANKTVKIGALNDESGPAAALGKPFADGKRLLAKVVNAGGSGLLPEGWKIELVERDHGYNPQKSVQEFNAIKGEVLFIATSFGTPNTLPLRDMLERETMVAFPASLSSQMAAHKSTPPLAPSYVVEAMRAMDWAVEDAGGKDKVKAAIVYQKDDYGEDGLTGWKKAAEHHGVEIVAEQTVAPGQKDVTAAVAAMKEKGANYVLLTVLPTSAGAVMATGAAMKYGPKWIGNTPAWADAFFSEKSPLPPAVLANFHWAQGLPYWGEELPGMDKFLAAYEQHKGELATPNPDVYILMSYLSGVTQMEALRAAIEKGDVTRETFMASLAGIKDYNAGGLIQPLDLSVFPYQASVHTRILKPDFEKKSWTKVADYAAPAGMAKEDAAKAPEPAAKPAEGE